MKQLNRFGWLFAIVALILFLMLLWYPKPTASGSGHISCTTHTAEVTDPFYVDASEVCGDGCLVESISSQIQGVPTAVCKCCTCSGDASLVKAQCDDNNPMSMLYRWLGACV